MVIEVALLLPFVINYYAMVLLWSNNNKHEMRLILYVALVFGIAAGFRSRRKRRDARTTHEERTRNNKAQDCRLSAQRAGVAIGYAVSEFRQAHVQKVRGFQRKTEALSGSPFA